MILIKNIFFNKNLFLFLLLVFFFFGRAIITLYNSYPTEVDEIRVFVNPFFVVFFVLSFFNFILKTKNINDIILFVLLILIGFIYVGCENYDFVLLIFISWFLFRLYKRDKDLILNSILVSGIIYIFFFSYQVYYSKGFELLMTKYTNGQNYIGSVLFVFALSAFLKKTAKILSIFPLILLFILKFRTALLALFCNFILNNYRKKSFYIIVISILSIINFSIGFNFIFNKWEGNDISSGRHQIWIHYIDEIIYNFPETMFPYIVNNESMNNIYSYFSSSIGDSHSPHNYFIEILLRMGLVLGVFFILIIFSILFFSKKSHEKICFISLLVFSTFEPTIGFSLNLISIFYYMILFFLFDSIDLKKILT